MSSESTDRKASKSDLRNVRDRVSDMEASVARIDERTKTTMSMVEEIRDNLNNVASQDELNNVKGDVNDLQETVSDLETQNAEAEGKNDYRRWLIEGLVGGGTLGAIISVGMTYL